MNNAIWFSRHRPTPEQVADLVDHYRLRLVEVQRGMELGSINLASSEDVERVVDELKELVRSQGAVALLGVFPAPVQGYLTQHPHAESFGKWTMAMASWNINRANEGQTPRFQHAAYVVVGYLPEI